MVPFSRSSRMNIFHLIFQTSTKREINIFDHRIFNFHTFFWTIMYYLLHLIADYAFSITICKTESIYTAHCLLIRPTYNSLIIDCQSYGIFFIQRPYTSEKGHESTLKCLCVTQLAFLKIKNSRIIYPFTFILRNFTFTTCILVVDNVIL